MRLLSIIPCCVCNLYGQVPITRQNIVNKLLGKFINLSSNWIQIRVYLHCSTQVKCRFSHWFLLSYAVIKLRLWRIRFWKGWQFLKSRRPDKKCLLAMMRSNPGVFWFRLTIMLVNLILCRECILCLLMIATYLNVVGRGVVGWYISITAITTIISILFWRLSWYKHALVG